MNSNSDKGSLIIIMVAFTFGGLGIVALGGTFLVRRASFMMYAERAEGAVTGAYKFESKSSPHRWSNETLVEFQRRKNRKGKTQRNAIVSYEVNGKEYDIRSDIPASSTNEGKLSVAYDSDNPRIALVDTGWRLWRLPSFFLLLGGFFAGIGIVGIRKLLG